MTRGWGAGERDLAQGLSPADSSLRVGSVSPLCPAWPLSMGSMSGPLRPRGKALWCALSDGAAQKWGAKGRKGPQGFHGGSSGGDLGVEPMKEDSGKRSFDYKVVGMECARTPFPSGAPGRSLVVAAGAVMTAESWDFSLKIRVRFLSLLAPFLWLP